MICLLLKIYNLFLFLNWNTTVKWVLKSLMLIFARRSKQCDTSVMILVLKSL
jgi:hypothetical protein